MKCPPGRPTEDLSQLPEVIEIYGEEGVFPKFTPLQDLPKLTVPLVSSRMENNCSHQRNLCRKAAGKLE